MSKFVFLIKYPEPMSIGFLESSVNTLKSDLIKSLNGLELLLGTFSVDSRVKGVDSIELVWVTAENKNDKLFGKLLDGCAQQLNKKLSCKCTWFKV